jgi:hypothetical protein
VAKEEKALRDARSLGERAVKTALRLIGPEKRAEVNLP